MSGAVYTPPQRRPFSFATTVGDRTYFVRAEAPSHVTLDQIARGEFDYDVLELLDGETDAKLDPQIVNTVEAVDAMRDDAWFAACEATRDDREILEEQRRGEDQ